MNRERSKDNNPLNRRYEEIREELLGVDPYLLAFRTGAMYKESAPNLGEFTLDYWGKGIVINYPNFVARDMESGNELGVFHQTLLAYYFLSSDGASLTGEWIAFSVLPDGMFYKTAFQGYSGDELTRSFGDDMEAFRKAALAIGGTSQSLGDQGYSFQVFPLFRVAAVCWLGDEDFPASHRILFDASASHHLSADACAVVGSELVHRLIKAQSDR